MILTEDERAVVLFDAFENFEYKHKRAIFSKLSSPGEIFKDKSAILKYFTSLGKEATARGIIKVIEDKNYSERLINRCVEFADGVITLWSDDYPAELKNTPFPPLALYYKGNRELLNAKKKFAIVGSRKTSKAYQLKTTDIAEKLARQGVVIVTGIAEGGDRAAIDGAIKSGKVISVFAGGLDCVYPRYHEELANSVAKNGLIITENPCHTAPLAYLFVARNRIIAGLAQGTLIVSGSLKSGTRHTAAYALDYGREVFCLPYGLGNDGEICKYLVKNGAGLVESAEEIAPSLGIEIEEKQRIPLTETEEKILKLIRDGVSATDEIVESSGLTIDKVIEALTGLQIKGLAVNENDSYSALT